MKEFMMPHTVRNRPTNGAVAPIVANTPVPRAICRDIAVSTRSSRSAMALLQTSSTMPPEEAGFARGRLDQLRDGIVGLAALTLHLGQRGVALQHAKPPPGTSGLAAGSMVLASQTVQVSSDASARPIITAFTTTSAAFTNMPHGERLRGSSAASVAAKAVPGSSVAQNAIRQATFRREGLHVA